MRSNSVGYILRQKIRTVDEPSHKIDLTSNYNTKQTSMSSKLVSPLLNINSQDEKDDTEVILEKFQRKLVSKSNSNPVSGQRPEFKPFKAKVINDTKLLIGPSPTVASLMTLPSGVEIMVTVQREGDPTWYQVSYLRRTGWVISTQVEEIRERVQVKQRRKMNFTGLSEREKDMMKLFETYDKERAQRAI